MYRNRNRSICGIQLIKFKFNIKLRNFFNNTKTKFILTETNAATAPTTPRSEQFHVSSCTNYPQAELLPMPNNIDQSETTRFSPQRSRDISSTIIDSHNSSVTAFQPIDITVDQSADSHIGAYDCTGAVHLSSSMQSNVPNPFGGMHKFTHLNMPGGQWGQGIRLMANEMHSSHYTNLRKSFRSNWSQYDETINKEGIPVIRSLLKTGFPVSVLFRHVQQTPVASALTQAWHDTTTANTTQQRMYSTGPTKASTDSSTPIKEAATPEVKTDDVVLSRKDKLKKAVKEYGSTVFVFHIGISLISLGSFYLLVSR